MACCTQLLLNLAPAVAAISRTCIETFGSRDRHPELYVSVSSTNKPPSVRALPDDRYAAVSWHLFFRCHPYGGSRTVDRQKEFSRDGRQSLPTGFNVQNIASQSEICPHRFVLRIEPTPAFRKPSVNLDEIPVEMVITGQEEERQVPTRPLILIYFIKARFYFVGQELCS
jgi:hypothetical protein